MPSDSGSRAASYVLPVVVPFLAASVVPWVVFSIIPFRENVTYDFPWAQLVAIFLVPFLGIGLSTAAAFLTGPATASMKHVLLAFASGAVGVATLFMSTPMLVIVHLEVITFLWSALLAVWVVALLRSLLLLRVNTPADARQQEDLFV